MKTAIVYVSTHGTTEKVAHQIAGLLPKEKIDLINLKQVKNPDVNKYDHIIIGASIHGGGISQDMTDFCNANAEILIRTDLGIYVCCLNCNKADRQFLNSFDHALRQHAKSICFPGGEIAFEKMSFVEKVLVKKLTSHRESFSKLDTLAVSSFVSRMYHN